MLSRTGLIEESARYVNTVEKIFSLSKKNGMNRSLDIMQRLCEIFHNPQRAFPTIHVAGTNGKGSVCTKIASCLEAQGYSVGLYTSPHISTYRERIRIGEEFISEEDLSSLFEEIQEIIIPNCPSSTFFEITTLLAFIYFQRQQVDIAVIETGLGGTWDATNVITPLVSVITSIGFDHMDVLGNSLAKITQEKAGIIKEDVPVVIGPDVSYDCVAEIAHKVGAPLYQSTFQAKDFDEENQAIARLVLSLISPRFPVATEMAQTRLVVKPSCRFERHFLGKEIVLDVAHNGHGFARLLQLLEQVYPHQKYRFVVGFSKNKDLIECTRLIEPAAHAIHIVSGEHPRLASAQEIRDAFTNQTLTTLEPTIFEGVHNAVNAPCAQPEVIIVCGTFFIMSEVRKALGVSSAHDSCFAYDPCARLCKVEL